jgi:hypothetical protein
MNARYWLALVVIAGGLACESGDKRIGSLEAAGETETGDACMGDPEEVECAEPQGVSFSWNLMGHPDLDKDVLWTCAANVESRDGGYDVHLTHCTDSQGQPKADTRVTLNGDGPEPEFADGDQPLTEFRFIVQGGDYTAIWMILRPVGQDRVSLLGFTGTKMIIDDPSVLSPLTLAPTDVNCAPEPAFCSSRRGAMPDGQVTRIGVEVSDGCTRGVVAENTMLSDLGLEQQTGTVYDVLVTMANHWQCQSEGGNLLELVIVGRTI